MKAEFMKDENDYIWFFYAKDIYMRENKHKSPTANKDAKQRAEELKANKELAKRQLIQELHEFEA